MKPARKVSEMRAGPVIASVRQRIDLRRGVAVVSDCFGDAAPAFLVIVVGAGFGFAGAQAAHKQGAAGEGAGAEEFDGEVGEHAFVAAGAAAADSGGVDERESFSCRGAGVDDDVRRFVVAVVQPGQGDARGQDSEFG